MTTSKVVLFGIIGVSCSIGVLFGMTGIETASAQKFTEYEIVSMGGGGLSERILNMQAQKGWTYIESGNNAAVFGR